MSLATAFSRLTRPAAGTPPVPDRMSDRRALLARAEKGRRALSDVVQPPESRTGMAAEFSAWLLRTRRIDVSAMDADATRAFDAYVDSVRASGSSELSGRRGEQAAAWLGERIRSDQNLNWTEEGLVTDGRLAFDPAAAIDARLASSDAPTVARAVDGAMDRIERETLAATIA